MEHAQLVHHIASIAMVLQIISAQVAMVDGTLKVALASHAIQHVEDVMEDQIYNVTGMSATPGIIIGEHFHHNAILFVHQELISIQLPRLAMNVRQNARFAQVPMLTNVKLVKMTTFYQVQRVLSTAREARMVKQATIHALNVIGDVKIVLPAAMEIVLHVRLATTYPVQFAATLARLASMGIMRP